jgi:hypothetical protein
MTRMLPTPLLLGLVFAATLAGCGRDPWDAYPMATMPDKQCNVGSSTHGTDLYIWYCIDHQRVAIGKYSAEMSSKPPERSTAPCGAETELEQRLAPTPEQCQGPRDGRAWRAH